jgi:hypothetical protein
MRLLNEGRVEGRAVLLPPGVPRAEAQSSTLVMSR